MGRVPACNKLIERCRWVEDTTAGPPHTRALMLRPSAGHRDRVTDSAVRSLLPCTR